MTMLLWPSAVRGGSVVHPAAPFPPGRQKLEGEEQLEAMANKVAADTQPKAGNAKSTIALAVIAVVVVLGWVGYSLYNKRKI